MDVDDIELILVLLMLPLYLVLPLGLLILALESKFYKKMGFLTILLTALKKIIY